MRRMHAVQCGVHEFKGRCARGTNGAGGGNSAVRDQLGTTKIMALIVSHSINVQGETIAPLEKSMISPLM